MNRRENIQTGFVKFPLHEESSNEGGMYVELVVTDESTQENSWMECCGGGVYTNYSESLVFIDTQAEKIELEHSTLDAVCTPDCTDNDVFNDGLRKAEELGYEWKESLFPNIRDRTSNYRYLSKQFLAAITMGSTGWSGEFRCTYDNLTDEGKTLYDSIQKLYAGKGKLHLITWLDT